MLVNVSPLSDTPRGGVRKSSVCLYVLRLVLPYHYKAHCCHINLRLVEEEEQGRIPEVPGQLANTQVPRSELISDDESIEIDPGILGDQIQREDMLAGKTKKKQAGSGEGRGLPPEEEEVRRWYRNGLRDRVNRNRDYMEELIN
ncbi:hypothetical protein RUM43_003294 [Polyplax serrata]|uniref:Uncharacterized protein n=1 Tax=Polyplax serrata TaxID=468196 RepID=A0AAN8PF81_POLSC